MKFPRPILAFFLSLVALPAMAEEFYVELGRANSESEAQATYATLQKDHKTLAKYSLFPNQILQADGSFIIRIQAGPMATKEEASRTCRRLFRKQLSCFVIEGFDPTKAKSFDAAAKAADKPLGLSDFLPWSAPKPKMIEAAPLQEPQPVSADASSKPKKRATVEVTEAIAVPVTENVESNEVSVGEAMIVSGVEDAPVIIISDNAPMKNDSGWLNVQPFLDEKSARNFWEITRRSWPLAKNISTVRVIQPVVSHGIPKVILVTGPYSSEAEAMKLCRDAISGSPYLECRYSNQPPEGNDVAKGEGPQPADDIGLYWVQVLSEKSQDKALEKWEKIRTDNDDVLSDVRSQITTSFNDPGNYVVKIGPVKSRSKAAALCDTLKARKVACSLVSL